METNIILAGVGGQGILSISFVIDMSALRQGLHFKQAEVHGMSQRGGAVQSHLRISDHPVHSDLVPKGRGNIILAVEPLESLRYVDFLSPEGTVISGTEPFINIPDYGDVERVLDAIGDLPSHVLLPAERLARQAGSARAANMVLLGAASPHLGLTDELLETSILEAFARKGERVQSTNIAAYRAGKAAGHAYRSCLKAGIPSRHARVLVGRLTGGVLQDQALPVWKELLAGPLGANIGELLKASGPGRVAGDAGVPQSILALVQPDPEKLRDLLFKAAAA